MRPGAFPNFLWLVCQVGGLRSPSGQLVTSHQRQFGDGKVESLDELPSPDCRMDGEAFECLAPNDLQANLDLDLKTVSKSACQGDAERIESTAVSLIKTRIFSEGWIRFMVRSIRHVLPRSWGRYMRAKQVKHWVWIRLGTFEASIETLIWYSRPVTSPLLDKPDHGRAILRELRESQRRLVSWGQHALCRSNVSGRRSYRHNGLPITA